MSKAAVFTMKLEADLRTAFMAEAEANHRPASQVVRELMRDYVTRERDKRDRTAFLQKKVDLARTSIDDGEGWSDEIVETEFAKRRSGIADPA